MSKPRLLDLFAGAGGATRGYQLAGFHVTGVDIAPQPHYCGDEFHQADALTFPLDGYDAIHASPPCQAHTQAQRLQGREHPDHIGAIRDRLAAAAVPWVIENVPGSPIRPDAVLCGSMFGLRWGVCVLYRHRWFESGGGWLLPPFGPASCLHNGPAISIFGHSVLGASRIRGRTYKHPNEREHLGIAVGREAMGIDWMTRAELSEAIPPAYTHWIGAQLLLAVVQRNAA